MDADLEAAEVHRRVIAAGGPALLFRSVRGAAFPLVTNLFGSARRIELAFGSRPETLISEAARLPEELMPPTAGRLWARRGLLTSLLKHRRREVEADTCCRWAMGKDQSQQMAVAAPKIKDSLRLSGTF